MADGKFACCDLFARAFNGLVNCTEKFWVRFIRALRLIEYSKRPALTRLRKILNAFHDQTYAVWQGRVDYFRLRC
jgi:hypothetical protein